MGLQSWLTVAAVALVIVLRYSFVRRPSGWVTGEPIDMSAEKGMSIFVGGSRDHAEWIAACRAIETDHPVEVIEAGSFVWELVPFTPRPVRDECWPPS